MPTGAGATGAGATPGRAASGSPARCTPASCQASPHTARSAHVGTGHMRETERADPATGGSERSGRSPRGRGGPVPEDETVQLEADAAAAEEGGGSLEVDDLLVEEVSIDGMCGVY